jgi:hypothetical protein
LSNNIVIKKGLKLGELDAESDESLLASCFVDNGQKSQLLDIEAHASVILGRTGAGKSAMVYQISREVEHSVTLDPNDISLQFLEHSNIIKFFDALGINLDLFYRVLWRHILTVELLRLRYELKNESQSKTLLETIVGWVHKDDVKSRALAYFREWGDKFWLDTDEQLRVLTSKLNEDVKLKLGAKFQNFDVSADGVKSLSEEVKREVKSLATEVVSSIQIQRLAEVLDLLRDNAFNDRQKRFYILIDKLDEDWADTAIRCQFIRALIEETKFMRRIPQVKIVSALRVDLLNLVFDRTRGGGFQEEKYEAYLMRLSWSFDDLSNLLQRRVGEVYKRQYTSENVKFEDVFPSQEGNGTSSIQYIIDRTLGRPRDAIQFANECFSIAADRPRISWSAIRSAEAQYSTKRLKSLLEEWSEYYPAIAITLELLRGITTPTTRSVLNSRIEDSALELSEGVRGDPCVEIAIGICLNNSSASTADLLVCMLQCLYHVGVIGMKISTSDPVAWSHINQPRITRGEVKRSNQIEIHPMFTHTLEVTPRSILSLHGSSKSSGGPKNRKVKRKVNTR